jgi:hypothetical protein
VEIDVEKKPVGSDADRVVVAVGMTAEELLVVVVVAGAHLGSLFKMTISWQQIIKKKATLKN